MKYDTVDKSVLGSIDPTKISMYLSDTGWHRHHCTDTYYAYRCDVDDSWEEVIIPRSREYSDYVRRLEDLLSVLTIVEGRSSRDILSNIISGNASETIQYKFDTGDDYGTISVDWLSQILHTQVDMTAYAYLDMVTPKQYHKGRSGAAEVTRNMKMGQTSYGSYVVRFIYPFETPQKDLYFNNIGGESIKSVASKILESSRRVIEAATDNETNLGVDSRISYNFVDSFLGLKTDFKSSIEMKTLSPTMKNPGRELEFSSIAMEKVTHIAEAMKPSMIAKPLDFQGKLYSSTELGNTDEDMTKFKIEYFDEDGATSKASLTLNGSQRKLAMESITYHKLVSLNGLLTGYGRTKTIEDVTSFRVI